MQSRADPWWPAVADTAADEGPADASSAGVPPHVPRALRDGPYHAVCRAWAASHVAPAVDAGLVTALEDFAAAARRAHVPIVHVLRTLNGVGRTAAGRDFRLARPWAGRVVIAAYFRGD